MGPARGGAGVILRRRGAGGGAAGPAIRRIATISPICAICRKGFGYKQGADRPRGKAVGPCYPTRYLTPQQFVDTQNLVCTRGGQTTTFRHLSPGFPPA